MKDFKSNKEHFKKQYDSGKTTGYPLFDAAVKEKQGKPTSAEEKAYREKMDKKNAEVDAEIQRKQEWKRERRKERMYKRKREELVKRREAKASRMTAKKCGGRIKVHNSKPMIGK